MHPRKVPRGHPLYPKDAYKEYCCPCTSCDECININKKLFAYDENKQAYIADPKAGTFRELVMGAEKRSACSSTNTSAKSGWQSRQQRCRS